MPFVQSFEVYFWIQYTFKLDNNQSNVDSSYESILLMSQIAKILFLFSYTNKKYNPRIYTYKYNLFKLSNNYLTDSFIFAEKIT